jgi:hypothetical protein
MLNQKFPVSGISLNDGEIVETFKFIFEYLWGYEKLIRYKDFDERSQEQIERDRVLLTTLKERTGVSASATAVSASPTRSAATATPAPPPHRDGRQVASGRVCREDRALILFSRGR